MTSYPSSSLTAIQQHEERVSRTTQLIPLFARANLAFFKGEDPAIIANSLYNASSRTDSYNISADGSDDSRGSSLFSSLLVTTRSTSTLHLLQLAVILTILPLLLSAVFGRRRLLKEQTWPIQFRALVFFIVCVLFVEFYGYLERISVDHEITRAAFGNNQIQNSTASSSPSTQQEDFVNIRGGDLLSSTTTNNIRDKKHQELQQQFLSTSGSSTSAMRLSRNPLLLLFLGGLLPASAFLVDSAWMWFVSLPGATLLSHYTWILPVEGMLCRELQDSGELYLPRTTSRSAKRTLSSDGEEEDEEEDTKNDTTSTSSTSSGSMRVFPSSCDDEDLFAGMPRYLDLAQVLMFSVKKCLTAAGLYQPGSSEGTNRISRPSSTTTTRSTESIAIHRDSPRGRISTTRLSSPRYEDELVDSPSPHSTELVDAPLVEDNGKRRKHAMSKHPASLVDALFPFAPSWIREWTTTSMNSASSTAKRTSTILGIDAEL
ncbi:unnamed protein product [Amoebophrya sp. A25]|nr:unnamed protein product [Amoebophrya sp. A25]|eukprot:GSA25T00009520001.1